MHYEYSFQSSGDMVIGDFGDIDYCMRPGPYQVVINRFTAHMLDRIEYSPGSKTWADICYLWWLLSVLVHFHLEVPINC